MFDPNDPVVKLCSEGMMAEAREGPAVALNLFQQAWDVSVDDFGRAIAAHYLARHQPTPADRLRWNQIALDSARSSGDPRAESFYPSLCLCVGKSHEELGDLDQAEVSYREAARHVDRLPADGYGDMLRRGVADALSRFASSST